MKQGVFSKSLVVFIVSMIIIYTVADFWFLYTTGNYISDTLTTCWFSFFAVELVNLMVIKNNKLKNEDKPLHFRDKSEFGTTVITDEDLNNSNDISK